MNEYNYGNVRKLLEQGFSERELRVFCSDVPNFQNIESQLGENDSKAGIVDKIIHYARRRLLMPNLLAWAREKNSSAYELYGPYYAIAPNTSSDKSDGELAGPAPNYDSDKLKNINHCKNLIANHQRRLQKLKEQKAFKGTSADPSISLEIEDIEKEVEKLQKKLKGMEGSLL